MKAHHDLLFGNDHCKKCFQYGSELSPGRWNGMLGEVGAIHVVTSRPFSSSSLSSSPLSKLGCHPCFHQIIISLPSSSLITIVISIISIVTIIIIIIMSKLGDGRSGGLLHRRYIDHQPEGQGVHLLHALVGQLAEKSAIIALIQLTISFPRLNLV